MVLNQQNKCLIIKKVRRFIPDYELLADLCCAALRLRAFSVSIRQYQRLGEFNPSTLIERFGSWNRACELAGLTPVKIIRPTPHELMENLAEVWKLLGRQPRLSDMTSRNSKFSRHAYINCFSSWYNTLTEFEKWINRYNVTSVPRTACPATDGDKKGDPLLFSPLLRGRREAVGVCANYTPRYPGLRLRMEVLKRDRYKCKMCGRSPAQFPHLWLEVDHDIPWAEGGSTTLGNLQTLCNECNRGKGDLNN